ncbi:hypothetical protein DPEC_G00361360 [Dallia pectoralis]|uniref:Uncharacterized protein n=1 Tax=Dallia pectoralis TaxID=75939 RepID=A0ACC2F188_DALPE|nr:hypothetical protein DPEC_G00361360 [Dallia pectoralis]
MIGRADIEGSKSDVAMNAWPPQASYPCGNFSDTSCLKPKKCTAPVKLPTCHCPRSGSRPARAGRLTPEARARSGLASPPHRSTGQKSHRVNTHRGPSRCFVLIKQSDSLVRTSSKLAARRRTRRPAGARANGSDERRSLGDSREGPGTRPESPPPTAPRPPPVRPSTLRSDTAPTGPRAQPLAGPRTRARGTGLPGRLVAVARSVLHGASGSLAGIGPGDFKFRRPGRLPFFRRRCAPDRLSGSAWKRRAKVATGLAAVSFYSATSPTAPFPRARTECPLRHAPQQGRHETPTPARLSPVGLSPGAGPTASRRRGPGTGSRKLASGVSGNVGNPPTRLETRTKESNACASQRFHRNTPEAQ